MAKQTRLLLILVAVLAAVLSGAWLLLRETTVQGEKSVTVTVLHRSGTERSFSLTTEQEYLGGALTEAGLVSGRQTEYGLYILTVDGETADESKQQWWGYTVNGTEAVYAVDEQPIRDGDTVGFMLYEGW